MVRAKQFDEAEALEKAMDAFWSRGFEATSVQDLVDRMGINRGSLYATFGDKRALFRRAMERYDAEHRARRLNALAKTHPPRKAIEAFFEAAVEESLGDRERRGCFITNTALELKSHDAKTARTVAKSLAAIEAGFRRLIARAQARGEIDPERDARALAAFLLGCLLGIRVLARVRPQPRLLRGVAETALAALGAPQRSPLGPTSQEAL